MTPNLMLDLASEPTCFIWNGTPITLSGKYALIPDDKVKNLHRRVLAVAHDDNVRIPFYGRVVGAAKFHSETIYLVEDESSGKLERVRKPQVIE